MWVDYPMNSHEDESDEQGVDDALLDQEAQQSAAQAFAEIASDHNVWSHLIRSRVLMDAWHGMARIRVGKNHGFRRPFARALRDAILIPDPEDQRQVSDYLLSIGSHWDTVLRLKPKWLWKRCKRIVPPPEQLFSLVSEVYTTFGPLLDASTRLPLLNAQAWKDAANILKAIKAGLLSDPPGIALYFHVGIDKSNGNLPMYRCARGTNNAEGGVHHLARHQLSISGASPRHANARIKDIVLMRNLMVRQ